MSENPYQSPQILEQPKKVRRALPPAPPRDTKRIVLSLLAVAAYIFTAIAVIVGLVLVARHLGGP